MRHSLGRVVATAAFAASVPEEMIIGLLDRHASGDWGDLDANDKAANDADHSQAEGRLFSSYATEKHGTIWVITEDLRSEGGGPITTVLFPEDYSCLLTRSPLATYNLFFIVWSDCNQGWVEKFHCF